MKDFKITYNYINELIERYSVLSENKNEIIKAAEILIHSAESGGKILICGNGGSSADADHIVGELMKGFLLTRPLSKKQKDSLELTGGDAGRHIGGLLQRAIPALSLSTHSSLNTAFINDVDPALIFAQQVMGLGKSEDILWGLSTSGNSENVVNAAITAKSMKLKTFAMTGKNESRLSELCDVCIRVNETETYKIQELHLPIYHTICIILEEYFFA